MYMTPHGRQQVHMKERWKTTDIRDAATLEPRTRVVCVCVVFFWCVCVSPDTRHSVKNLQKEKTTPTL